MGLEGRSRLSTAPKTPQQLSTGGTGGETHFRCRGKEPLILLTTDSAGLDGLILDGMDNTRFLLLV
jgi:hypothetical protein